MTSSSFEHKKCSENVLVFKILKKIYKMMHVETEAVTVRAASREAEPVLAEQRALQNRSTARLDQLRISC